METPQNTDKFTKGIIINYLKSKGYVNIRETYNSCYYDLSAELNGKEYRFELKFQTRCGRENKYKDHVFEQHKLDMFTKDKDKFENAYLITFFGGDDTVAISDVFNDKHKLQKVYARKTTSFADNHKTQKTFVSYNEYKLYSLNSLKNSLN